MNENNSLEQNNNQAWLVWLRVIATIAVIILHCCAAPLVNYDITDYVNWLLALVLRNIVAVSVPLFFMMSGYLYLIKSEINISHFLRKRMMKIILPLLIWSYFWILYNNGFNLQLIGLHDVLLPFKQPAMYHLWFMYPLIGLYLALPLIHSCVRNLPIKSQQYALYYWVLLVGLTDYFTRFFGFTFAIPAQFITIWVGYFVAGYLITAYNFKPRLLISLCVAIITAMIFGTYWLTNQAQPAPSHMYELGTAHMMLLALGIFWLAHHYKDKFKQSRLIELLSDRSYVVYLVHPLFMMQTDKLLFGDIANLPIFYLPIMVCITVVCSYGFAILLRTLWLNKIFG